MNVYELTARLHAVERQEDALEGAASYDRPAVRAELAAEPFVDDPTHEMRAIRAGVGHPDVDEWAAEDAALNRWTPADQAAEDRREALRRANGRTLTDLPPGVIV